MRQFDAKVVTMTQAEFDGLGGRYQPDTTYIVDGVVKKIGDADLSTGSGSVAVQALSADRALNLVAAGSTPSDNGANLTLTANRAVTVGPGFDQGVQFTNNSATAVTIAVTPTGGATLNGGTAAVTRTIQPWQTTALSPVSSGATSYALHGA